MTMKQTNYRKIYEQHYGPIPKDKDGRTYEIHHLNGNHDNNLPENLKAITIQEHYNIHYARGDYGTYQAIAIRMKLSPEKISDLARRFALERVVDGSHHLIKRPDGTSISSDKVANKTHNLLGPETNRKRVENGTHNFLDSKFQQRNALARVENGTHASQTKKICEYCNREFDLINFGRWHGKNCKTNKK